MGVASIAFSAGGVPEILVDERALALPGNIGDLVDKIRMALESPELRKALVDASRPALLESDLGTWRRHLADLVEAVAPSAALSAPSSGFLSTARGRRRSGPKRGPPAVGSGPVRPRTSTAHVDGAFVQAVRMASRW